MIRLMMGLGLLIVLLFESAPKSDAQISFYPYRYRPLFSGYLAHSYPILTLERSPQFGMNPYPFEHRRRPLNVPQIPRRTEPVRQVVYIYPPAGAAPYYSGMTAPLLPYAQQQPLRQQPPMIPPHLLSRPDAEPETREGTVRFTDQLETALEQFRNGYYDEAVQSFKKLRERVTGNAMVEMGYALSLFANERPHLASQSLRRALTLHPTWFSQPLRLGAFYSDLESFYAQWENLTLTLHEEPTNKHLHFLASYLAYANNDLESAHEYVKRLLEVNPGDVEASALLGQIVTKSENRG